MHIFNDTQLKNIILEELNNLNEELNIYKNPSLIHHQSKPYWIYKNAVVDLESGNILTPTKENKNIIQISPHNSVALDVDKGMYAPSLYVPNMSYADFIDKNKDDEFISELAPKSKTIESLIAKALFVNTLRTYGNKVEAFLSLGTALMSPFVNILFEKTMLSKVDGKYTADYLWDEKKIVSFLKIDKGLDELQNGVKLMKNIEGLSDELKEAKEKNIFGTKMRSVIYEANAEGIKRIVDQQFEIAKIICDAGLVPIIEPEVDIHSAEKEKCEEILKKEIKNKLATWNSKDKITFKFTIPSVANHYLDLYDFECVVRIVALSGGYDIEEAVELLSKNNKMIASFSRALLQDLNVNQSSEEFDKKLEEVILKIYNASIT